MIDRLIKYIVFGFFILFPIFYLPVTPESYEYNKMTLLVFSVLIFLFLTCLKIVHDRKFKIIQNNFSVPLFFIAAIFLISTLFQSQNIVLPLTTPLSTASIIAGFIFFFLLIYNLEIREVQNLISLLVVDSCIISSFALLQQSGILPDNSYTPAGTLTATVTFLSIITVYLVTKIFTSLVRRGSESVSNNFVLHILAFILTGGTTVLLTFRLFTTQKPILLPFVFGWTILLEVLKNWRTGLLGVGPTNFITAFSLAKPISFNSTPYWNMIFTSSSSFLLNLTTETGILAGLFYAAILLKSFKLLRSHNQKPIAAALLFALILQIFLPGNMTVFITTVILLAMSSQTKIYKEIGLHRFGIFNYLFLLPVIVLVILTGFYGGRYYWAEATFKESLDALLNDKGTQAYNLQSQAIDLNPSIDRYHIAFSRTSLALANALAAKKDLTEGDKQNIPNLVKQAIDQARLAVTLNRTNEINWDNLARVYSGLIGYAQGAENWTAYSFQQKLILDPYNPNTYLALTGLNLQLNKYPEAENLSRRAIFLKPDLANAHYFLNLSLQGQKKYKEAYSELQKVSSLLPSESEDGKKIGGELAELEKLVPKEETSQSAKTGITAAQNQNLELNQATPSALQNVPEAIPTITLPQIPK